MLWRFNFDVTTISGVTLSYLLVYTMIYRPNIMSTDTRFINILSQENILNNELISKSDEIEKTFI